MRAHAALQRLDLLRVEDVRGAHREVEVLPVRVVHGLALQVPERVAAARGGNEQALTTAVSQRGADDRVPGGALELRVFVEHGADEGEPAQVDGFVARAADQECAGVGEDEPALRLAGFGQDRGEEPLRAVPDHALRLRLQRSGVEGIHSGRGQQRIG